jgi:hypothetical protein
MTGPPIACTSTPCGIEEDCPLSATVKAPKPLSPQRAAPLPSRKLSLNSASATSTRATLAFISENYLELTASIGAIAIVIAILAALCMAAKKERALMILSPSIA